MMMKTTIVVVIGMEETVVELIYVQITAPYANVLTHIAYGLNFPLLVITKLVM